jgi:hypothetical protein
LKQTVKKNLPAIQHAGEYGNDGHGFCITLVINTNTVLRPSLNEDQGAAW